MPGGDLVLRFVVSPTLVFLAEECHAVNLLGPSHLMPSSIASKFNIFTSLANVSTVGDLEHGSAVPVDPDFVVLSEAEAVIESAVSCVSLVDLH